MEQELISGGLGRVWEADNIAIVVLMLCLLFSGGLNIILLRGLLQAKDILTQIAVALATLNERLDHDSDH